MSSGSVDRNRVKAGAEASRHLDERVLVAQERFDDEIIAKLRAAGYSKLEPHLLKTTTLGAYRSDDQPQRRMIGYHLGQRESERQYIPALERVEYDRIQEKMRLQNEAGINRGTLQ